MNGVCVLYVHIGIEHKFLKYSHILHIYGLQTHEWGMCTVFNIGI